MENNESVDNEKGAVLDFLSLLVLSLSSKGTGGCEGGQEMLQLALQQ